MLIGGMSCNLIVDPLCKLFGNMTLKLPFLLYAKVIVAKGQILFSGPLRKFLFIPAGMLVQPFMWEGKQLVERVLIGCLITNIADLMVPAA